jgi:F-type H+-transporting ATPase subunit a
MSAEAHAVEHAVTAPEYIGHHLRHLQNFTEKQAIVDWNYINYDSIFWSFVMGAVGLFLLRWSTRKPRASCTTPNPARLLRLWR